MGFVLLNNIELKNILKKDSYAEISVLRMIGSIGVGIALSQDCVGILYRIQHWNDANLYLFTGFAFSGIVLIIAIIKYILSKADFYKPIIIRLSAYLLFIILIILLKL
jgi:hypothetical protein